MKTKETPAAIAKVEVNNPTEVEEAVRSRYELKLAEMRSEGEYVAYKASSEAKVKGAAMRENLERLLRVMFLRETKARLKEGGMWSRYCQETGIDIKKADYEIDKLGDFRDELLLSFGEHCGYQMNKIKYLASGDSQNLGVTVENGQIYLNGEQVDLTPEDVQLVIEKLQENTRRIEEKAIKEKADLEKEQTETKRALKRAERELAKIKRDAAKKGLTPEETAFLAEMDEVKTAFEGLIERIDFAGADAGTEATPRMAASARTLIDYMQQRLAAVYVQDRGGV